MPSPLVLITGATGHIGFRVLVLALQAGHRVRASVRSEAQIARLSSKASIKPFADKLSFIVVKDITVEDAYIEALKDVTAVIHIASPIPSASSVDPNDANPSWTKIFYDPAIKGTLSVLKTASKTASVRRVVITSSGIVLDGLDKTPGADPYAIAAAPPLEAAEAFTDVFQAYAVSKIFSHHAATDFVNQNAVNFDLIRVLPGYTQGYNELATTSEELAAGTNGALISTALGQIAPEPKLTAQVLLEDVARAHVLALDEKVAQHLTNLAVLGNGGQGVPWDEVAGIVEKLYPEEVKKGILKAERGQSDFITHVDVSGSEKALGFNFAGPEEMVKSVVGQYLELLGK